MALNKVGWLNLPLTELDNFTTFDIMADLTFGESLHQLVDESYHPWVWAIFSHIKMIALSRVSREWPGISLLFRAMLPNDAKRNRNVTSGFLPICWTSAWRVSQNSLTSGASSLGMRDKRKPCVQPSCTVTVGNVVFATELSGLTITTGALFMLAGTETTATLLSGLTFMLLKHPDRLRRLTDEVRSSFPSEGDMSMSSLSRLGYLRACIEEGLRLYPPVAIGPPRTVPQGGATVCGRWVLEGVSLAPIVHDCDKPA